MTKKMILSLLRLFSCFCPHCNFSFWIWIIWTQLVIFNMARIPQLAMLQKVKEVENLTSHYVAALDFYRFFYIFSW